MELTSQQMAAAHSPAPVTLVPSGAGSGKTRVLVERVMWLLDEGATPDELCIVTFTQAAALELKQRIDPKNIVGLKFAHIGTLHSLLLKLLRRHGHLLGLPAELTVMSEDEADAQLQGIATSLKVKASMKLMNKLVAKHIQRASFDPGDFGKKATCAQEFVRQMKQTGELSYDALLELGHRLIVTHPEVAPFKHILWDEKQDSAVTDWRIFHALKCETKFCVGDPRQRIYSFRGASDGFERMMADPGVTQCPISTNFRSSVAVVAAANRLLPHQEPRPGAPQGAVTLKRYDSAAAEVSAVACACAALPQEATIAVLLRTNKACDLFRAALLPFGVKAEERNEAKGDDEKLGVAMLRAMCAPHNDRAVLALVKVAGGRADALKAEAAKRVCSIGSLLNFDYDCLYLAVEEPDNIGRLAHNFCVGALDLKCASRFRDAQHWLQNLATRLPLPCSLGDLLLLATQPEPERSRGRIHLGTVHSFKGLEADYVYLPAFEDEVWPGRKEGEELDEEKRLAYVAVTRARLECHMSWCAERPGDYAAWKVEKRTPSRFAVMAGNVRVSSAENPK